MVEKQRILDALREVYDPELGINVVDLGLIYDIEVDETDRVQVTMTLTTPGCPLHDSIVGAVERRLRDLQIFRDVRVDLVWNPPWTPERISEEALEELKK